MPSWDWDDYVARLKSKGYGVKVMFDKKKLPHGYSILVGNSSYKASDLGKGRNLMVSKIEKTWQKLHPDTQTVLKQSEGREGNNLASTPKQSVRQIASIPDAERISGYSEWRDGSVPYTATHDGKQHNLYIPGRVLDLFNDEFDYREVANYEELTNFAVAIFVGLTALDTVSTGGGGGGGNNDGWRDRKDEDEIERASAMRPAQLRPNLERHPNQDVNDKRKTLWLKAKCSTTTMISMRWGTRNRNRSNRLPWNVL